MEYKIIKDGNYIKECENCGSEVALANFPQGAPEREDQWLCEYCSSILDKSQVVNRNLASCMNILERKIFEKLEMK